METRCISIKRGLKDLIRVTDSGHLRNRLRSLCGFISRVLDSLLQKTWASSLLDSFNDFIEIFNQASFENLPNELEKLETTSLRCFVDSLQIPQQNFQLIYQESKDKLGRSQKISKMIPMFLDIYLKKIWSLCDLIACLDFDKTICIFFRYFDIPYNHFSKSLAIKYLGQGNDVCFKLSSLETFLGLFLGSIKNYKFYVKVARAIDAVNYSLDPDFQFLCNYKIILTSRSKNYFGSHDSLPLYTQFLMDATGVQRQGSRRDGIIIFGRHQDADVAFPPDEKNIDLAAFLIINSKNRLLGIDISSKTYCSLKLQSSIAYEVNQGQLLNLAKTELFLIKSIDSFDSIQKSNELNNSLDYSESNTNSILTIENQEGSYKGISFEFHTQTSDPNSKRLLHIIGCGGGGISPDFFIHPSSGISQKHMELRFEQVKKTWSISDSISTNGTYILMKNFEQYLSKKPSAFVYLIGNDQSHGVFMIEKNVFFISVE